MSDPIFCQAQTYPQTRETPAEFCETEVDQEGDFCPIHEEPDDLDPRWDDE